MRAPVLNRKLTLETPVQVADGAGGVTETWIAEGELWAELRNGAGREKSGIGGAISVNAVRITVRAAAAMSPARPRVNQRFREGSRIFNIDAVTEAEPRGWYLLCHAKEEVRA